MTDRVRAILLAGGESRRMGVCKQTLPLGGKPVIVHCVDVLTEAGVVDITVVVGKYGSVIRQALGNLKVDVVEHGLTGADMADSVRTGLSAMGRLPAGVMICLSDHPLVTPETIGTLLTTQRVFPGDILIPGHRNRNGHPVIFPSELLAPIHQGGTLRDIIQANPERIRRIPVDDSGVIMDMDTPEDYQLILIQNTILYNHTR